MVKKFAERANADVLRRAVERSQSMIDAQRAEDEKAKEQTVIDRRKQAMKEKVDQRREREEAALLKAREKATAKRMPQQ